MGVELYYFSGTGNSLHIAKELQKRIPASRITPIVSLLGRQDCRAVAGAVGFVFPIHFIAIPKPMKHFIRDLNVDSAEYLFAIATRLGSQHIAFAEIDGELKKKGRRLDAHFSLTMGNNDPKYDGYQTPTEDQLRKLQSVFDRELDVIYRIVSERRTSREEDTTAPEPIPQILLSLIPYISVIRQIGMERFRVKSDFYADSRCTGCGTCEKVCLSQKIKIVERKPVWQSGVTCSHCYTCLNYCPRESVQIKGWTEKNGRCSHPYATANDIAKQKNPMVRRRRPDRS